MTDMSCEKCDEIAPELALNLLCGKERAEAVAHLECCPRCRATMSAFCDTTDQLLELIPEASPPAGFEVRTLSAIAAPVRATHRWYTVAAAVVLGVALLALGWLLGRAGAGSTIGDDDRQSGVRAVLYAPLTTSTGERVGQVYVYPDRPGWMYVTVTLMPPNATVHCRIRHADGTVTPLGDFPLTGPDSAWKISPPVDEDTIVTASMTDPQGHILSTARFPPTSSTEN